MTRLLRAEALRLATTRAYWLLAAGATALIAGWITATAAATSFTPGTSPARTVLAIAGLAQTVALLTGVLAVTSEFRHKTITPALLITPRRTPLLAAKLITLAAAGLVFGLAATGTATAITLPLLAARHVPADLTVAGAAAMIVGGGIATALFAALGVGVGAIIRNQAGAIIAVLALLYVAEFHGVRSGACQHRGSGDPQLPRAQRPARRPRAVAHRPQLQPGVVQHGPGTGSGGAGADLAADGERRIAPAHPRVLGRQLGRVADALGGLRYGAQVAGLDAVQGLGQQGRAGGGEPGQQVTGGVLRADRLGHHPVYRPGVQLSHQAERGSPGDVVAVPDGVRDRRGAPPRGQQREMQVHPPVRRYLQRRARDQRAVRGHRAAVGRERTEPVKEVRIPGLGGLEHLDARIGRAPGDRARADVPAPSGRRVGPGKHRHDLVLGPQQFFQRGHRRLRGAGEKHTHYLNGLPAAYRAAQSALPQVGCGEIFTLAAASPHQSDSRISFMASFRCLASSRSMNSTPSR